MSEKTCFPFVNAWHVTSSLPLSDVIVLHTECCVENKFSSSHPPGLLWFGKKGGETIHGHYHTVCVQHRYVGLLLVFCLHLFVIYFDVCQLSDFMRRKTVFASNNKQRQRVRDEVV